MKIEAGKFYRTRGGQKAGPAMDYGERQGDGFRWVIPLDGHPATYFADGWRIRPNMPDPTDIILEWYDDADESLSDGLDACTEMYAGDIDLSDVDLAPGPVMFAPQAAPGYGDLHEILQDAFDQSASGKGRERHANDKPFDRQPIMEIGRMVGPGYAIGQLMKKAQEAMTMQSRNQHDAADRELLGVIVYAAAAVKLIRESRV